MAVENYQQLVAGTGKVDFILKKRKCKVCRKILSMYNLNEYCFVHSLNGARRETIIRDKKYHEKQEKAKRACKEKHPKKRKEIKNEMSELY